MSSIETTPAMAVYPSTVWVWHVGEGVAEVERVAQEWNDLAHDGKQSPTADAIWTACAWQAFGSVGQRLYVHSLRDEQGRLLAALPLVRDGRFLHTWKGLPDTRHIPCWDFAFDEKREGVGAAVIGHLLELTARIDLYQIPIPSAAFVALTTSARAAGHMVWQSPTGQDAVLEATGPWESFRASLSKKLMSTTEQKLRRLRRMGELCCHTVGGEDALDATLGECFALEAKGWKGQQGTAIANQSQTLRFYSDLARASAQVGRLELCLLRLDGRLIAFEYCLRDQSRIEMLKIGYDPDLAKHSPSYVLRYLVLQEALQKGETNRYHMGLSSEWKQRWVNRMDDLVRLRIYRRSPGGVLTYLAGPRLRATLKQSRTLCRAMYWVRGLAEARTRGKRRSKSSAGEDAARCNTGTQVDGRGGQGE